MKHIILLQKFLESAERLGLTILEEQRRIPKDDLKSIKRTETLHEGQYWIVAEKQPDGLKLYFCINELNTDKYISYTK